MTSTLLYFNQASIVAGGFTSRGAQTSYFATVDLIVNTITLVVQVFLTGRLVRWLGVPVALALLPGLSMLGFGIIAVLPTLDCCRLVPGAAARRQFFPHPAGAAGPLYGGVAGRPLQGKELHRYRRLPRRRSGGSVVLRADRRVFPGITQSAIVGAVLSAVWLINSLWLGKRQEAMVVEQDALAMEHDANGEPGRRAALA